uniref:Uncharacterized protein n=1 Tax=Parascaris equorum TaxID=6256 RepID=A0A914RJS4_PAREQ
MLMRVHIGTKICTHLIKLLLLDRFFIQYRPKLFQRLQFFLGLIQPLQ